MSLDLSISKSTSDRHESCLKLRNTQCQYFQVGSRPCILLAAPTFTTSFSHFTLTIDSSSHVTPLTTHHSLLESLQVLLGLFAAVNLQGEFSEFGRLDRLLLLQLVIVALDVLQIQTQLLTRPTTAQNNDGRTDGHTPTQ